MIPDSVTTRISDLVRARPVDLISDIANQLEMTAGVSTRGWHAISSSSDCPMPACADFNPAHFPLKPRQTLRRCECGQQLIVFRPACLQYAAHLKDACRGGPCARPIRVPTRGTPTGIFRQRHRDAPAGAQAELGRQAAPDEDARDVIVVGPFPFNFPGGVQLSQPGWECFSLVHQQKLFKPCSDQHYALSGHVGGHIEEGCEGHDVIAPENLLELDQFVFGKERAGRCRSVVYPANGNRQAICRRRN